MILCSVQIMQDNKKKNAYTLFLNMIKYKYSKCFTRVPHAVKHLFSFRRFP